MAFKKLKATVMGRVQGVGFRWYVQRMAGLLSVTGWVKNSYSGEVEVEAIGTENQVKEFLLTLQHGPSMSEVTDVKHSLEDCDYNNYGSFDIKY